jgi:hypothetical protein
MENNHEHDNDNEFDYILGHIKSTSLQNTSPHLAAVYKGFAILLGIYVFFIIESLMKIKSKNKIKVRKIALFNSTII